MTTNPTPQPVYLTRRPRKSNVWKQLGQGLVGLMAIGAVQQVGLAILSFF